MMRLFSWLLPLWAHIALSAADLGTTVKPGWASAVDQDSYGVWADLQVDGVTQRFRWIPPSTFMMGLSQAERDAAQASTPTNETESVNAEIQHQVTLTQGYWLADSACSQAMWLALMGTKPSKCNNAPQNPVEQVSWDDCQQAITKLNHQFPGSAFSLPSEAQWEYACRAGTVTAFSYGSTITPEQVNYNGLFPIGGAEKGLYRQKTVPVKSLPPNAWGLYEMHGNVWQWCNDYYADYAGNAEIDPAGPAAGSRRVSRGGSWFNFAKSCRSASRYGSAPDRRSGLLGFRLAARAAP